MSPGQTGHITGQMGRVPGTDGTHTRGCPAKILYVDWFFSFPIHYEIRDGVSQSLFERVVLTLTAIRNVKRGYGAP